MRQLSICLLFILTVLSFASCKKHTTVPGASISGNWELRQTSGGPAVTTTTYAAGNGYIYKFDGANYQLQQSGNTTTVGTYSITNDPYAYKAGFPNILTLTSPAPIPSKYYLHIEDNLIILYKDVANGYTVTFQRI